MRSSSRVALPFLLLLGTQCGDDEKGEPADTTSSASSGTTGASTSSGGTGGEGGAPDPSPTGDPCTPGPDIQGTCPEGYACFPSPGGYCTQTCGFSSCAADATCVPSPRNGELCAKTCAVNDDCRVSEGYTCDPDYKACVQWQLSPKLASCAAPSLARNHFGPVLQLATSASPQRYQFEPAAALDATGTLTAVFNGRGDLFELGALAASTVLTNGTVDGDRALDPASPDAFDAWMASDNDGKLHLVWYGHDGQDVNPHIFYSQSDDGFTWTAAVDVLPASDCPNQVTGCTDKPMIAIGPDPVDPLQENLYVAFGGVAGERVIRSIDGGVTFSPSVGVSGGVYGDLEVASDGSVHLVNADGAGDRLGDVANTIRYNYSTDGGQSFVSSVVEDDTEPTPFYFSNAQVVFNAVAHTVHVVYPTGGPDGVWNIRLATSSDDGQTWSRITVNDDAPCANHATPTIVLDEATGDLHLAWIENRSGVGGVAYTRCAPDGQSCDPNEAINVEPFASYVLVRHSPRWMGEYFNLVIDPVARELHAVWTQPVDEGGLAVSRIFHSQRAL